MSTSSPNPKGSESPIEKYRHSGDPLADETVAAIAAERGVTGVGALLDAILDVDRLPADLDFGPEYQRYLNESLLLPDFVDDVDLNASVDWFNRYGWTAFSILGCASLPAGYGVADVPQVLATTQELTEHVQRRLWETIQFVIDSMDAPGLQVDPDDPTRAIGTGAWRAQKVRLFHAIIRFLMQYNVDGAETGGEREYGQILLDHHWDPARGVPINQGQMSGTILSFSFVILRGLKTLGYDIEPEMQQAYLARWNVIGHLMGVKHELLRWDFDSADELYSSLRDPEPNVQGKELMQSLLAFMDSMIPLPLFFLRPTSRMLVVLLIGEEHAQQAGVELTWLVRMWLKPMKAIMTLWAKFYAKADPMQWAASWLYLHMRRHMIGAKKDGRRRFRLPAGAPSAGDWMRSARE